MIAADDDRTVAALGEFGLIAALSGWLPADPRTLVGIGDDAAVLAAPDGRVVASTDFLLEGRHFRRDWSSARDVGRKAAARSLIDVSAMGAVPTGLLVALAAPAPFCSSRPSWVTWPGGPRCSVPGRPPAIWSRWPARSAVRPPAWPCSR